MSPMQIFYYACVLLTSKAFKVLTPVPKCYVKEIWTDPLKSYAQQYGLLRRSFI